MKEESWTRRAKSINFGIGIHFATLQEVGSTTSMKGLAWLIGFLPSEGDGYLVSTFKLLLSVASWESSCCPFAMFVVYFRSEIGFTGSSESSARAAAV